MRLRRRYRLDGDALARLYDRHAATLLRFLAARTFDSQVAVDLLAETFAQAFVDRAQFRGASDDEALTWLYGIARHQLSGFFRRSAAERRALQRLGVRDSGFDDADYERVEELVAMDDLRAHVRERLASLPPEHREILDLRVVRQLDYADVASRLGITEPTARARVSRALARLAAELDTDDRPMPSR